MDLRDVVNHFLLDCKMRQRTGKTMGTYTQRLKVLVQLLETVCTGADGEPVRITELEQVTVKHLRQCVHRLLGMQVRECQGWESEDGKPLDVNTVRAYVRVWKVFFNWCYQEELIDDSPVDRLKLPKAPTKITQTFTAEHLDKMLSACDPDTETGFRDYVILLLFLDTGMRLAEICGLKVSDVHVDYVKVYGKGRKEREIGITPEVHKLLWKYINKYRHPKNPNETVLFIGRGKPLATSGIKQMLARVKRDAGLPEDMQVSAHVFRHTFAKGYKDNNGDTLNLSREMGHSSVRITEIYLQNFGSTEARRDHNTFSPVSGIQLSKYNKRRKKRRE